MATEKILMLDTETTGTIEDPIMYNFGCAIIDRSGKVYETLSACVSNIFEDRPDLMSTAYYADKIPLYRAQIDEGEIKVMTITHLQKAVREMCERWNCSIWCAHNAIFDNRSMNNTMRFLTKRKYFLPYGFTAWDTMKMAQDVICPMKSYQKFCNEHGYICKNGQVRKTAEILYRFITGNEEFAEEHRALEDVLIEAEILTYCFKKHKKMHKELWD